MGNKLIKAKARIKTFIAQTQNQQSTIEKVQRKNEQLSNEIETLQEHQRKRRLYTGKIWNNNKKLINQNKQLVDEVEQLVYENKTLKRSYGYSVKQCESEKSKKLTILLDIVAASTPRSPPIESEEKEEKTLDEKYLEAGAQVSVEQIKGTLDKLDKLDKIVIDCQPLQFDKSGIGNYGTNLVNSLIENYHQKYKIILLINNYENTNLPQIKNKDKITIYTCNCKKIKKHKYLCEKLLIKCIEYLEPKYYLNLHGFDDISVRFNQSLLENKNVKTLCILHDLIPLKLGWLYKIWSKSQSDDYMKCLDNMKKYDVLLSNSYYTKHNCMDVFNNIEYVGTGVQHTKNLKLPDEISNKILEKFNINKKYIFFQSRYDHYKGFEFLCEKFLELPNEIKSNLQLVFGSQIPIDKQRKFLDHGVIITDYLSDVDLSALHKHAWLFVFPSFYEGFGIPVVEAKLHNTPVIVANNTSLKEIINDLSFRFDHNDDSLTNLIQKLYNDFNFYNKCKNYKPQKSFEWTNVVDSMINFL